MPDPTADDVQPAPVDHGRVPPGHEYLSTACLHSRHSRCRLACKYCLTPCTCPCHDVVSDNDLAEAEQAVRLFAVHGHHPGRPAVDVLLAEYDRRGAELADLHAATPDLLARALHDADCGCGDYDELEDSRYIDAARVALARPPRATAAGRARPMV